MTRHCDSNPAQYERNRRFGHLVHVLGREASGAKLPSVGLRLKASKSESPLVDRSDTVRASCALGGNARCRGCFRSERALWFLSSSQGVPRPGPPSVGRRGAGEAHLPGRKPSHGANSLASSFIVRSTRACQCRGAKSSVDDLGTGRGVVLSRAAPTLRSIETHPADWQICPPSCKL